MSKMKEENYVPVNPSEHMTSDGLVWLSHATIGEIDKGFFGIMVDAAIKKIATDLDDRGSDGKERTLTLKIGIKRVGDSDDRIDAKVEYKLPPYSTAPNLAQNRGDGRGRGLAFRVSNPERYDQPTIMDKGFDGAEEHDEPEENMPE